MPTSAHRAPLWTRSLLSLAIALSMGGACRNASSDEASLTSLSAGQATATGSVGAPDTTAYTIGTGYSAALVTGFSTVPASPTGNGLRDWKKPATDWASLVLDPYASGPNMPMLTVGQSSLTVPSFVGAGDECGSVCVLDLLLAAKTLGLDLNQYVSLDWVGRGLVYGGAYTDTSGRTQTTVYTTAEKSSTSDLSTVGEITPASIWAQLVHTDADFATRGGATLLAAATTWAQASNVLAQSNYTKLNFSLSSMQASAPSSGVGQIGLPAGIAYISYLAYLHGGNAAHLAAATQSLQAYQAQKIPYGYDDMLPYAPLVAARLNAEMGQDLDVDAMFAYALNPNGQLCGANIDGQDFYGLFGVPTLWEVWAQANRTMRAVIAMSPIPRYLPRYTRSIGRWLTAVAYNMSMMYPDVMPQANQSDYPLYQSLQKAFTYEGVSGAHYDGQSPQVPYAGRGSGTGVARRGANTDGSTLAMLMSQLVVTTNNAQVLGFDLLTTDYGRAEAYPTVLYYNKASSAQTFSLPVGDSYADVLDITHGQSLAAGVTGSINVTVPASDALLLVTVPNRAARTQQGSQVLLNGVVVDWGVP